MHQRLNRFMAGAFAIALTLVGSVPSASAGGITSWHKTFTPADGNLSELEIIVPVYEGLSIHEPTRTLRELGQSRLQLGYPGVLSVPLFAWRFGDGPWTATELVTSEPTPAELSLDVEPASLDVRFESFGAVKVRTVSVRGDFTTLAQALRGTWPHSGAARPLASRFSRVNFYVYQWVSPDRDPPVQFDWRVEELTEHMKLERPETLEFVYGFDPSGIDLEGRYFWSPGAAAAVARVLTANPRQSFLNWLNLRTFKIAIPRLGIERPMTPEVRAMARQLGEVAPRVTGQVATVDMCLASKGWQASRFREFDRLVKMGFTVIQLDEFPIPAHWQITACRSTSHLHRPGDIADEWRVINRFLRDLAARARRHGILLTCEEPSAALLPYVSGYIDRLFNDSVDVYGPWRHHNGARPIPFFAALFGDEVTPYTDADSSGPARQPPQGWIEQHKVAPPRDRH